LNYNEDNAENSNKTESIEDDQSDKPHIKNIQINKDGNIKKLYPVVAGGVLFQPHNPKHFTSSLINFPQNEANNLIPPTNHGQHVYYSIQNNIHPNNHYNFGFPPSGGSEKIKHPFKVNSISSSNVRKK